MATDFLSTVFSLSPDRAYAKDQKVVFDGAATAELYRIKRGYIAVTKSSGTDKRIVHMILGPGDIFPLTSKQYSDMSSYACETLSPTELSVAHIQKLEQIASESEIAAVLYPYSARQNANLVYRTRIIQSMNADKKLTEAYQYLGVCVGEKVNETHRLVRFNPTHQLLAELTGLTRETVTNTVGMITEARIYENTDAGIRIDITKAAAYM